MISFGPAEEQPTTTEAILFDGKVVGDMKRHPPHHDGTQYHAAIDLNEILPSPQMWRPSLAQGHGATPEAAIIDAIDKGRAYAIAYAAAIEALAKAST